MVSVSLTRPLVTELFVLPPWKTCALGMFQAPNKSDEVIRMAFDVKEQILPLQSVPWLEKQVALVCLFAYLGALCI